MKTLYVVIESYHADYEDHGSDPIGVYSSEELALAAIEQARLKNSHELTFEEFLEEGTFDPELDYESIVHCYHNYQQELELYAYHYTYSWYVKEFKLDGAE